MEQLLRKYLSVLIRYSGSDLHLKSGSFVRIRVHGDLKQIKDQLSAEQLDQLAREILSDIQYAKLVENRTFDFTYILDQDNRFRVNFFYQMEGLSAVFRIIPLKIPTIDELKLPETVKSFTDIPRGLVLVTGVTGSGKSTTLAAIIGKINETVPRHIITLEDPIEFVHQDKKCLINQRSVGQDALDFSGALRAALREDPDIILVGEIRDLETVELALHAANTGHLVFSTLHTLDAKETVNRVIGMFPQEEQNRVRGTLASVLAGVISQRLVPIPNGGRRVVAEILVRTPRIVEMIAENRDLEIPDAVEEGKEIYGSQTFDQHLLDLVDEQVITEEIALEYATKPSDLKLKLQGIGRGGASTSAEGSGASHLEAFEIKNEDND